MNYAWEIFEVINIWVISELHAEIIFNFASLKSIKIGYAIDVGLILRYGINMNYWFNANI